MGIAKEHLDEQQRRAIAQACFTVKSGWDAEEIIGLCPFHDEKNPSFSYNPEKDLFHCLAGHCGVSGDLADLWAHANGYGADDGFKAFCHEFGINRGGQGGGQDPGQPPVPGTRKKDKAAAKAKEQEDPPYLDDAYAMLGDLPETWIKYLERKRGWSRDVMQALGLKLQTHFQAKTGEIKKIKCPERVAIPVPDKEGHVRNIRLYKPEGLKEGESKIFSWGKAYGAPRLFPPAPDDRSPVLLCEGEPDMICARSQGFNAITQTGKPKKWSREHAAEFEGRDVAMAFDADQAGEKYAHVYAAPHLAKVVRSLKAVEWPDEMGRQVDGTWPEDHGQDLTDFFVRHKKNVDDFWQMMSEARPVDILQHVSAQALEFFERGLNDRVSFKPRRLAEKILAEHRLLTDPETGLFYRWNGRYWEQYHEDHVKGLALRYLGGESQKSRAEDAAYQVRILSTIPHGRAVNDFKDWVCVRNGMLNLETQELKPHDPEYYATYELNVTYDHYSDRQCDRWLDYLKTNIRTPEVIKQAQEFVGYCLTKDVLFAKCLIMIGPGSDGKSVFLKVLRELIGHENTTSVSFADLEDQFLRSSLYQKAINISTEIGSKALESPYFKAITSGDPINAAFKHKNTFTFTPHCKLVFASNKLPRVLDNSDGYFRRILPIQFKRQFFDGDAETDPHLFEKLKGELSEIFHWALVGLHRLWKQGGFTECRETDELMLGYKRLNNPVLCFVDDMCHIGQEHQESKKELYTKYREYCNAGGYKILSRENFFRELYTAVNNLHMIRPRVDGRREQYLKGIALNGFANEE